MSWRVGDDKRDTDQEGREWERRRIEKAFDVARKIRTAESERQGPQGRDNEEGSRSIGELADYLLASESKTIDKLVKDDLHREQQATDKARSGRRSAESFGKEKLEVLAIGFKDYIESKRDSQQPKEDAPRVPDKVANKPSFKDVMGEARNLRLQRGPQETQERSTDTGEFKGQLQESKPAPDTRPSTEGSHQDVSRSEKRPPRFDLKADKFGSKLVRPDKVLEPSERERGFWKVRIYHPAIEGRKIKSFDEVRMHIKKIHPGLLEHRDINKLLDQGEKHWKTVKHFEGRKEITIQEILEFAKSIDASDSTVRPWVTKKTPARIYSLLREAIPVQEAVERIGVIRDKLGDLHDAQSWRERMKDPYFQKHLKQTASWETDWDSAEKFYRFLDEMERGGTVGDVSRRVGMRQSTGIRYLKGRIPILVKVGIESSQLKVKDYNDLLPMGTEKDLQKALERHNHLQERRDFSELKQRAIVYIKVKEAQATNRIPNIKQREWASQLGISHTALNHYLQDKKRPELFALINASEKALSAREERLAPEALGHWITPSLVYDTFMYLQDIKSPTPSQLAEAIEKLHALSPLDSRVQFADLEPYYRNSPRWLNQIAGSIASQRLEIEDSLNKRMKFGTDTTTRAQIGVVGDRLYIRLKDTDRYNWMNIYKQEDFHFRRVEKKRQLIEKAKAHLGLNSTTELGQLIDQMCENNRIQGGDKNHYDLRKGHQQIKSESLHVILDSRDQVIQSIQSEIKRVGWGRYGVVNPRFRKDVNEIDRMFASVLGAGLSDGHVGKDDKGFLYTESDHQRVSIFKDQVRRFGDVYHSERIDKHGVTRIRYSSTFGRVLEDCGLTCGDRTYQNLGWPRWLKDASKETKLSYFGPMFQQDGSFRLDKQGHASFQVSRGIALRDHGKSKIYGLEDVASPEQADFVRAHGNWKHDVRFGERRRLTKGRLDELENNPNENISNMAKTLKVLVDENKPNLMLDEQKGLNDCGIVTKAYFAYLTYFEKTRRLSALWQYATRTKDDAMRVGILCPPDDFLKKGKVQSWMYGEKDRMQRVLDELDKGDDSDGL